MLSVIIPANNEQDYIADCLAALTAQTFSSATEIIVAANACTDRTVAISEEFRTRVETKGWALRVLDLKTGGKANALNEADRIAAGTIRVYLDADVILSPDLLRQLHEILDVPEPRYASGRLIVAPARSWVTRHYARIWAKLPFMKTGVQGAGLFAVNSAGRARWDSFPDIISDDGFVRLNFAPEERFLAQATYQWPLVEGFARLVKVRRRQDAGVQELNAKFPKIMGNESKPPMTSGDHLSLFLGAPLSYTIYVITMITVKSGAKQDVSSWTRGR